MTSSILKDSMQRIPSSKNEGEEVKEPERKKAW